jgi:hypothetical protein
MRGWKAGRQRLIIGKNSEQKQRWLATALLDLEPRLRRIRNCRALPLLREALRRQLETKQSAA